MEVQTAARALEASGRSVVHMEIGEPDFPTPAPVVVTAGSSAAMLLVMALTLDRDDQVLMSDPGYPCNRHFVRTLEGEPVGLPVGPATNYQLSADLIDRSWSSRTRAVLIASPSNPTGTTVELAEMRRIAEVVAGRGGRLIVDEIYLGLSYGGEPESALRTAEAVGSDLFIVSSFSKYFNMTGWRLGWLIVPERHVRDVEKLAQNLYISPATVSQRAALACFQPGTLALLEQRREAFRASRDFLVPALRDLGFGIPVIEAMSTACPVASSNSSSLPEVCGDAAVLFDPYSPEAIAEGVERLLADPAPYVSRGLARAPMFTWEKTAAAHVAVYEELAA